MSGVVDEEDANFQTFRECLSAAILRRGQDDIRKPTKNRRLAGGKNKQAQDAPSQSSRTREDPEDMADFIAYLASETFTSLSDEVRTLSYSAVRNDSTLAERYDEPLSETTIESIMATIPAEIEDTLLTYKYVDPPKTDMITFMTPLLNAYVAAVTAAPPEWITTRASACEICDRDWIPLTYHHLIPRGVHAKVLKRGWHEEWTLNSVAWLCRACHSFVHRMASNEELARDWFTIDKILDREDVQSWASWVGRVRWKTR